MIKFFVQIHNYFFIIEIQEKTKHYFIYRTVKRQTKNGVSNDTR